MNRAVFLTTFKSFLLIGLMSFSQLGFSWSFERDQKWEGWFQIQYQFDERLDGRNDTYVDISDDLGWGFGFGYNLNSHLNASFNFNTTSANYRVFVNPDNPDDPDNFRHTSDYYSFQLNGQYNILKADFTPVLQAGIGSGDLDTNIRNGYDYCYWDPWWGYICNSRSYSASGFAYNFGAGLRWDYSRTGFVKLLYVVEFVDLDINDNPEFETIQFQFGGKF